MYKLYWSPGGANMAPHAVLNEIGCPRELILVDIKAGANKQPAYLALNPHGRVPTLQHDGVTMYESAAICLYLAERHPEATLMPLPGAPKRAHFLQWLAYLTNTVQEELQHWWHAEGYVEDHACHAAMQKTAEKNLDRMWRFLDDHLKRNGPFLLGQDYSCADIFLAMLMRWSRNCTAPAWTHPTLGAFLERVKARPAYRRMLEEEGIA